MDHHHHQGERSGVPNYELQVSYSTTPQGIHEMGFVQFEENQVLSFLAPSQSAQMSQPLNTASTSTPTPTPTNTTTNTTMGFTHNDLLTRPSWNNEQVMIYMMIRKSENCCLRWGFILSFFFNLFLPYKLMFFFLVYYWYLDLGVGVVDTLPFVYFYMFLANKH